MRVLIAGCGYVGAALAARLEARGDEVWRLRRSADDGPRALRADVTDPETLAALPAELDALVYAVSADRPDPDAYERAYVTGPLNVAAAAARTAGGRPLPRFVLVSSTGVYGQRAGELVDEDTDPAAGGPLTPTGEQLRAGERAVLAGPLPATVLRLAGIYGPGRESRIDAVLAGRARKPRADVWTNRIHRDDAAGALEHLLDLPEPHALYLGVDNEPTTLATFLDWLGERLGVPVPEGDDDALRPRGSKRCRNARLRASGYRFRYPTFREGYGALLRARGL